MKTHSNSRQTSPQSKRTRWSLKTIIATIWPLLPVILFAAAGIIHISVSPEWRGVYLYSSDSTTLASLIQSLQFDTHHDWIFSSQLFFFPEALFYSISFLFTQSIYGSFIFNSVLNVVAAYFLFYWISRQFFDKRIVAQFLSVLAIAVICGYMLLEIHPTINQSAFVTLFLFTTYYYGTILVSLGLIALSLYIIKSPPPRRLRLAAVAATLITAVAATSNPLVIMQFSLPFCAVVVFLFFINRLPGKTTLLLLATQIGGILLSLVLRYPIRHRIGLSADSYISIENIPVAFQQLRETIAQIINNPTSLIEYIVIIGTIITALIVGLTLLYKGFRRQNYLQAQSHVLFAVLFGALAPLIIVVTTLFTGNAHTRYFIPITFFPLIALIAWISLAKKLPSPIIIKSILVGVSGIFIIYCLAILPRSLPLTHALEKDQVVCFNEQVGKVPFRAIGSFWTGRSLDLYSDPVNVRVVQASSDLKPYPWMNNRALYTMEFNAVIVDTLTPLESNIGLKDVAVLGPPNTIKECPGFFIYIYNPGTPGHQLLNQRIHS